MKTKLEGLKIPPEYIRLCLVAIGADDGIVAQSRPLDKTLTHDMIYSVDTYEYWSNEKFDECFNVLRRIRWIQAMRAGSNWMMNVNWEKSKHLRAEEAEMDAAVLHVVREKVIKDSMIEKWKELSRIEKWKEVSETGAAYLMSIA